VLDALEVIIHMRICLKKTLCYAYIWHQLTRQGINYTIKLKNADGIFYQHIKKILSEIVNGINDEIFTSKNKLL